MYSSQTNLIVNKNKFNILTNLNSENILSYSNIGKNLSIQYQKASLLHIGTCLFLHSIYFTSHHSKIGTNKKYNTRNIIATIITSTTYFDSKKFNIFSKTTY
ncbi:MAG: hypothetical protein LBD88_01655 [Candidatus Peribacteria bacterium]|jgi:hypothetical protein|nr:hypothetical protein [Candidatus Peribacteria bacterium]